MADLYHVEGHENVDYEVNQLMADNVKAVAFWCDGVEVVEHDALDHDKTFAALNVRTSIGMKRAQEGDYIVKRPTGLFLVVKPDVFHSCFTPVTPVTPS